MVAEELEVRVLVQREGEWWVAICLEHFLAVQSKEIEKLEDVFAQMFVASYFQAIELGATPFANMGPAPRRYVDAYEAAGKVENRRKLDQWAPRPLTPPYVARFRTAATAA